MHREMCASIFVLSPNGKAVTAGIARVLETLETIDDIQEVPV
jgi:hypothetical protein